MNEKIDIILYRIGIGTGCLLFISALLIRYGNINIARFFIPCIFHRITGFYCPGCGGTRAVRALLQGKVFLSILYHPFVVYMVSVYAWYMVSNTIEKCVKGKISIGMKYKDVYLWIGIILILFNWFVKNIILLVHYFVQS